MAISINFKSGDLICVIMCEFEGLEDGIDLGFREFDALAHKCILDVLPINFIALTEAKNISRIDLLHHVKAVYNIESDQRGELNRIVTFISTLSCFLNKLCQILLGLLDSTFIMSLKSFYYVVTHAADSHFLKLLAIRNI